MKALGCQALVPIYGTTRRQFYKHGRRESRRQMRSWRSTRDRGSSRRCRQVTVGPEVLVGPDEQQNVSAPMSCPKVCSFQLPQMCSFRLPLTTSPVQRFLSDAR